mgnify:CR=1 FL=1
MSADTIDMIYRFLSSVLIKAFIYEDVKEEGLKYVIVSDKVKTNKIKPPARTPMWEFAHKRNISGRKYSHFLYFTLSMYLYDKRMYSSKTKKI